MPWFMFLPLLLYYLGGAAALYVAFRFVRAFERRGVDRAEVEALRTRMAPNIEPIVCVCARANRYTLR
jgi:hypothetical protein